MASTCRSSRWLRSGCRRGWTRATAGGTWPPLGAPARRTAVRLTAAGFAPSGSRGLIRKGSDQRGTPVAEEQREGQQGEEQRGDDGQPDVVSDEHRASDLGPG